MRYKIFFFVFILLLSISLFAQENISPGSEIGDAVFRPLSLYDPGWQQWYAIGHVALYRSSNSFGDWDPSDDMSDSDLEHSVIQATGEGTEVDWQTFDFFLNGFQAIGGGYTCSNKPTTETRKNIISIAKEQYGAKYPSLRDGEWYYPKIMTPRNMAQGEPGCFRCDALVEYCYEQAAMGFFTEEEKFHCWFRDSEGRWIGFPIFYPVALKNRMTPEAPTPPELEVSSPEEGDLIEDEVNIGFTADDGANGSGIDAVFIHIDNKLVHEDDEDSDEDKEVEYKWDCSDVSEGTHYIKIEVYDRAGNLTEKEIKVYKGEAPIVVYTAPYKGKTNMHVDVKAIVIHFSREMDQLATENAVTIEPSLPYNPTWFDERTLDLNLSATLDYCTEYTITISGEAKDTMGVHLDGNGDGDSGDPYIFTLTTEPPDIKLSINPEVANVEEGHPIHPKLYTNGVEIKKEVDCNVDFNVYNSGGWTVTEPNELSFSLLPGEIHDGPFTIKNNGASFPLMITSKIPFKCDEVFSMGFYWTSQGHMADHPDENQSPGNTQYPTPWLTRTQSLSSKTSSLRGDSVPSGLPDIGILLSGWADGYGHILGKYGISTLPIKPDLKILNNPNINISDSVKLLVIGSAGLKGFNSPTFENDLENYVVNGGNLLVFTQKYGSDLSVLPGSIDGYGWDEDQSCYGRYVVYLNQWHPVLSGQKRETINCTVDGYFFEFPENSEILLGRTKNAMPALLYYNYGAGTVIVSSYYSDWSYGHGGLRGEELSLIRDLTTWAVNPDMEIPEFYSDSSVSVPVAIEYKAKDTLEATAAVIKIYTPDRDLYDSLSVPVSLNPGGETEWVWNSSSLPEELGLWIIDYALMDENENWIQGYNRGAVFAQKVDVPVGDYNLGDFQLWVGSDKEEVLKNDTVDFEVFIKNNTDSTFTGKVIIAINHRSEAHDSILGVTIPSDSTINVTYRTGIPSRRNWRFGLYKNNQHEYQENLRNAVVVNSKGVNVVEDPFVLVLSREKYQNILGVDSVRYTVKAENKLSDTCSTFIDIYVLKDSVRYDVWSDTIEFAGRETKEINRTFFPADYEMSVGRGDLCGELFFRGSMYASDEERLNLTYPSVKCSLSVPDSFNYGVSNPYTVTLSSEENYIPSGKLFVEGNTFLDSIIIEGSNRADTTFYFDYNPDVWEIPERLKVQYEYGGEKVNKGVSLPLYSPLVSSFKPQYEKYKAGFLPGDTAEFEAQLSLKGGLYGVPLEFSLWSDYLASDTLKSTIIFNPCSREILNFKDYIDVSMPADTPIVYNYRIKYLNKEYTADAGELTYSITPAEAVLQWLAGDTFSIGSTIPIRFSNEIKTPSRVDIKFISISGNGISESFPAPGEITVPSEGYYTFTVTVPDLKKGKYRLRIVSEIVEGKGINLKSYRDGCPIYIDGIEADIEVTTDKKYYGYGEDIPFSSLLENGQYAWNGAESLKVARVSDSLGEFSIWDLADTIETFGLVSDGNDGYVLDDEYSLGCIGYIDRFGSPDEEDNLWVPCEGGVEKWEGLNGGLISEVEIPDSIEGIVDFVPYNGVLYFASMSKGKVYKLSSTTGEVIGYVTPPHRSFLNMRNLEIKENGNILVLEDTDPAVLWELSNSGDSINALILPDLHSYHDMAYRDGTLYISGLWGILRVEEEVVDTFSGGRCFGIDVCDNGKLAVLIIGEGSGVCLFTPDGKMETWALWNPMSSYLFCYKNDILVEEFDGRASVYREFGKDYGMIKASVFSNAPHRYKLHSSKTYDDPKTGSISYSFLGQEGSYPGEDNLLPLEDMYGTDSLPPLYIDIEGYTQNSPVFNDCSLNIKVLDAVDSLIVENEYPLNLSSSDNISFGDTIKDTIPSADYCVMGDAYSDRGQQITSDWKHFTVIGNNVTLLLDSDKEEGFPGDTFGLIPIVVNPLPEDEDNLQLLIIGYYDENETTYVDTTFDLSAESADSFPFSIAPEVPGVIKAELITSPSDTIIREFIPLIHSSKFLSLNLTAPDLVDFSPFEVKSRIYNYSFDATSVEAKRIFLSDTLIDTLDIEKRDLYTLIDTFMTEEPGTLKLVVSNRNESVVKERFISLGLSGIVQLDSLYRVSPDSVAMSGIVSNAGLYPIKADALFCLVDGALGMPADDMHLVADFDSHGDTEVQSPSLNPATTPDISHKDTKNTKEKNVFLKQNPNSQLLNPNLTNKPINQLTAKLSAQKIALSSVGRVGRDISLSEFISGLTRAGIDTSFFAVDLSSGVRDTVPIMFNEHAVGDYLMLGFLFTDAKSFMFDSTSSAVNVVGNNQVLVDTLIVSEYCDANGNVIFTAIIENQSFGAFTGNITISSLYCYIDSSIDVGGDSKDTLVFLIEDVFDEGIYTFTSVISEGGVEISEKIQEFEFHPVYKFTSLPVGLETVVPDSGIVEVALSNIGNSKGERILKVDLADVLSINEDINMKPASIDTFTGDFLIPEDFPGGEYFADATVFKNLFPETDTFFNVSVNGLIVEAHDSLDRPVYSINDTAELSIFVKNKSLWSGKLFAGLQYGELELDTSFILGGMEKGVLNETLPRDTLYLDTSGIYMFDPMSSESYDSVRISWNASLSDSFIFQMRTDSLIGRGDWITIEKGSTYILDDWMQIYFANKSTETQWIDAICLYFNSLGCTKLDTFPLQREIVTFEVPADSSEEKLGWGIYYPSGRSVVLDERYVYLSDSMLTIFTDKGRYEMEDTVHATLYKHFTDTHYTFNYRVYFSPTEEILDSFKLTEDTSEFSFVVPDWTRSGTYSVDYWVNDTTLTVKDMHLTARFPSQPEIGTTKNTKIAEEKDILIRQNPTPPIPNPNLSTQPLSYSTAKPKEVLPIAKQWVMGKPTLSVFGEGAFISGEHLFDVDGITIYFKNASMDTSIYNDGDIAEIRTEISSDIDCSVTLDISSTGTHVKDTLISLASDAPNKFAFEYPIVGCRRGTNELYLHLSKDSVSLGSVSLAGFVIYFDVYLSDSIAPIISVLKVPTNTYASNRYYELLARIYNLDENGTPFHDTLYYRAATSGGASWHPLIPHSSRGDTNKYLIPSHPNGTHIEYLLVARDEFGNRTCYPEEGYGDFWVLSPLRPAWEEFLYNYVPAAGLSWNSPEEFVYYHCGLSSDTIDVNETEVATRFTSQYTPAQLQRIGIEIINTNGSTDDDTVQISIYSVGPDMLPGEKMDSFMFTDTINGYTEFNLSVVDIPEIGVFTGITGSAGLKVVLDGYGEGTHTAVRSDASWDLATSGEMLIDGMVSHLMPSASSMGGPSEILSYDIFKATDLNNWTNIASGITGNSYTDTLIEENQEYYYKVMVTFGEPLDSFFGEVRSMFIDLTAPTLDTIIIEDGEGDRLLVSAILRDTSGIAWDSLGYKWDDTVRIISEDSGRENEHFFSLNFPEDTFEYFLKTEDSSLIGNYVRFPASGFFKTILSYSGIREFLPDSTYLNRMLNVLVKQDVRIKYALDKEEHVNICMFDITGRKVKTLLDEKQKAGYYSVPLDSSVLPRGIYFLRMTAGDYMKTTKLVKVR